VLASVAVPQFSATAQRAARSEALIPFEIPTDASVTPEQAAEALYAIVAPPTDRVFRSPARSHGPIFSGEAYRQNPTGLEPHFWSRDLVPRLGEGLDPAVAAYLQDLGRHPALAELGVIARARAMDEAGAFYALPLPEDMSVWEFPIPRYGRIRDAAYAQVGAAVGDAAAGRVDEAEGRLRELISAGRLLGNDGQTLIANLVGFGIAGAGGEALANLYDATGRVVEGAALRERMAIAERAARRGRAGGGGADISTLPDIVTDSLTIRGLRWEYLITLSALGPCLNLNRAVFGPPEDYGAWLDEVRGFLVRSDSEEAVFQLALRGWGLPEDEGALLSVARLFGRVVGGGVRSCTELAAAAAATG